MAIKFKKEHDTASLKNLQNSHDIESLEQRISELTVKKFEEAERLRSQKNNTEEEMIDLEERLGKLTLSRKRLEAENITLKKGVKGLTEKLDSYTSDMARIEKYKQEIITLGVEKEELEGTIADLRFDILEREKTIERKKTDISDLNIVVKEKEALIEKEKDLNRVHLSEISDRQSKIIALEGKVDSLCERIKALEGANEKLQKTNQDLKSKLSAIRSLVKDTTKDLSGVFPAFKDQPKKEEEKPKIIRYETARKVTPPKKDGPNPFPGTSFGSKSSSR